MLNETTAINRAAAIAARNALGAPEVAPKYKILGVGPNWPGQPYPLLNLHVREDEKRRYFGVLRREGFTIRRVYFGSDEGAPIIFYDGEGRTEYSRHDVKRGMGTGPKSRKIKP